MLPCHASQGRLALIEWQTHVLAGVDHHLGAPAHAAAQVLLELAACAAEDPGCSWRVGVGQAAVIDMSLPVVHHSPNHLKGKARNLLDRRMKPAVRPGGQSQQPS
jgi:hypothetical protein